MVQPARLGQAPGALCLPALHSDHWHRHHAVGGLQRRHRQVAPCRAAAGLPAGDGAGPMARHAGVRRHQRGALSASRAVPDTRIRAVTPVLTSLESTGAETFMPSSTASRTPFAFVELPQSRSQAKPRTSGLTMMADFGLPYLQAEDLLAMAGRYIDFAKIAVGTSRLYDLAYLRKKLALYRRHRVRPFVGGQFQEYVFATYGEKALRGFLREARRVGFDVVEISDNCVPLTPRQRRAQIRLAIDCGLAVFGEVGSKDARNDARLLVAQAEDCFAAGAEVVLVEAAELIVNGKPKT